MPQIIPMVVTAITTVTSAVAAAGPLAVAAFNAANVIGAAALAGAAFQAIQPEVKSSSTSIEWNADPNAPNRFAFGRVGGAGNIIHNTTYGPDKMYVGFVGVMSASGPIKSWVGFKADDAHVSFNGAGMAISSEYANEMWLGRQLGRQPEPSYLPSPSGLKNGAGMPRWGASYKLSGKAAYIYTLSENSKRSAYKGKVPTGIHTIEGLFCYDPRFDSSYPGGIGPCRLDDPATWLYSTNAYIHALSWAIGRWEGQASGITPIRYGVPYASMKVGGIGARPEGIDFAGYVEAANVFDENGWACAAWPDADQGKGAVLDSFLQAGGGVYAERQGKISCMHRAAPRTSIATITAEDTAGTIEYDTTTSILERINTIRPEYWSEAHGWQMVATDEVSAEAWRIEDGQGEPVTRSKGLAFNYVPQSKQARELAALQVSHTREPIRGTAPLRHYLDLEVGDCFTFDVPEAVLNGQKVIVLNVDPDLENDIIHVTFSSETDGKYPFAFGQADAPPPMPGPQPADNTVTSPMPEDWVLVPKLPNETGVQIPIIDVIGEVSNSTATAVHFEWALSATGPWKSAGIWPPTVTELPIPADPGVQVWVRASYFRGDNFSEPTLFGPVVMPDLVATDTTHLNGEPVQDVLDRLDEANDAIFEAGTGLKARTDAMYADINTATTGLKDRTNALWADVNTASTGIKARLNVVETNLTSLTSSTASRLGTLEATINTPGTGLVSKIGALETATANLETYKADASTVNSIVAEIAGARNGKPSLSAELSSMRLATSDGLLLKASAAEVALLQSTVNILNKDRLVAALGGSPAVTPENFTNTLVGPPATIPPLASGWTAENNPDQGMVYRLANVARHVLPAGWEPIGVGRTHRVTAVVRVAANGPNANRTGVGFRLSNEAGLNGNGVINYTTHAVANGWQTLVLERTSEQLKASSPASTHFRVNAFLGVITTGTTASGATVELASLWYDDVTDATNLSAKIGNVTGTVADALAGKADASRAAALEATVNTPGTGLVAKVGGLETATANLQANKAEASTVDNLSTELTNARNGKANLAAELSSMRTATSDGLSQKASVAEFSALKARSAVLSNLIDNPSGAYGPRGWIKLGAAAGQGASGQIGPYFEATSGNNWASDFRPYEANSLLSLGYNGTCDGVGGLHIQFLIGGVYTNRPVVMSPDQDWGTRRETAAGTSMPESGQFRIVSYVGSGTLRFSNVMVNVGPVPVAFRDDYSARAVGASLTTYSNAIADLQNGKADASRAAALEATINTPGTGVSARLNTVESVSAEANGRAKAIQGLTMDVNGYISGHGSTNDGNRAEFFILADAFSLLDPDGSGGTEYRDGCWFLTDPSESTRTRYGRSFGGTHKLVWWTGPSSVSEGSESKANAYVYISMNTTGGPRFGGSDVRFKLGVSSGQKSYGAVDVSDLFVELIELGFVIFDCHVFSCGLRRAISGRGIN